MEKNRIYNAAIGCILAILFATPIAVSQDVWDSQSDTTRLEGAPPDTSGENIAVDSVEAMTKMIFMEEESDSLQGGPDTLAATTAPDTSDTLHLETVSPTAYYRREYISRGVGDELKGEPNIFMCTPGPTGSPQIPLLYLNTPGIEICLNDQPFLYNDIYRPYVIGSDVNAVPWEILNEIHWNDEKALDGRIHIDLGKPPDVGNRSDVELARGPYSYNSSRWRFFRPFGAKTYGYFTVGFKKSNGYLQNSDYNGYHITGGGSHVLFDGLLEFDAWKYRAKSGLNSFEYLTPQTLRHSRTTHRYEVSYNRQMGNYFAIVFSGIYQKNGLIAKDQTDTLSIDRDIGGGKLSMRKTIENYKIDLGLSFYKLRLYKQAGITPSVKQFEYFGNLQGSSGDKLNYDMNLKYSWNGLDHGELLPLVYAKYNFGAEYNFFVSFSRSRRLPDLNLNYFNSEIATLGVPNLLESYGFQSTAGLKSPVTSRAELGTEADFGWSRFRITAARVDIKNQIYLSYQSDTSGNVVVSPVNFDDRLIEFTARMKLRYGVFDGELGGSFRKWNERYFDDGLEKGPAAIGFGRLSVLKSFFFDDLLLGGSLEALVSTRQDFRSIRAAYLDGFGVLNGRLEFNYKDFIFWWNEDNLTNNNYTTWWPYPRTPRTLWWGFRWRFYD